MIDQLPLLFDEYSSEWKLAISVSLLVGASLSFIGTSFILVSFYFVNPSIRYNYRLLFWLSISDFVTSISGIFAGVLSIKSDWQHPTKWECDFQGAMIHAFNIAEFLWTGCIVVKLLLQFHGIEKMKYESTIFHGVCWGIPAVEVIILTVINAWGNNGSGWCWIHGARNPLRLTFYIPLFIVLCFSLVSVVIVLKKLPKARSSEERTTNRLIVTLSLYPMILIICWAGALVNRIQNAISPTDQHPWLYVWEYGINTLQGFLNALVFIIAIRTQIVTPPHPHQTLPSYSEFEHLIEHQ